MKLATLKSENATPPDFTRENTVSLALAEANT